MRLLIVAATGFEIKPLIRNFTKTPDVLRSGLHSGVIKNKKMQADVLITGPGINQTAYHLASTLQQNTYEFCFQAGICGSFNKSYKKGDVVQVVKEKFGQSGAEDGNDFVDLFEMGLLKKNDPPYKNGWLLNKSGTKPACLQQLKKATGITVETVHGKKRSIKRVVEKYAPDVESMEGAAFFYACLMHQVSFTQIRAVSNRVEKRNKEQWDIELAVENLNDFLTILIHELQS